MSPPSGLFEDAFLHSRSLSPLCALLSALSGPATDYGTMVGIGLWSKRPFEFGEDDEKIADEAIVRHLEDRGLRILVDGDNDLRILHSGEVLDGTRNADSYVQI